MSAFGPQRTFIVAPHMSAFGAKADIPPLQVANLNRYDAVVLSPGAPVRRRDFFTVIIGSAFGWPLAAHAQQQSRRVGVVIGYAENDPETRSRLEAFRRGLAKRGWSEGHNIHIDYRFAAGDAAQISILAREIVGLKPEVIVAHTTRVAETLQKATREIPIVFLNVSDPIGAGFVKSLARPDANLTGLLHYEPSIVGKWLAMIKEVTPNATRVCILGNPETTPFNYF